jgi:GT2 family glycosyltransferase
VGAPRGAESRISVAVTTHARPRMLAACLASIAAQTRPPDEVIVSQDGSDPESAEVVRSFAGNGLPIRYVIHDPPLRQLGNRQHAIRLTHGDLVGLLDDDDTWEPEFLERTSWSLESHPECGFCSTDHYLIGAEGAVLDEDTRRSSVRFDRISMPTGVYDDVLMRELRFKPFPMNTTLFRRELLERIGFFPEYAAAAPDLAVMLELGAAGTRACYIAERLGSYRVHEGQAHRARVEQSRSLVSCLAGFALRHDVPSSERKQLESEFRQAVIEHAVALAHDGRRGDALRALRDFPSLGWGAPSPGRTLVLCALVLGAGKLRRRSPKRTDGVRIGESS